MLEITFLLQNKSEHFYNKIEQMTAHEIYLYLKEVHNEIKPVINKNNQLIDQINFNNKLKSGQLLQNKVINKRKGFNLLTLTF